MDSQVIFKTINDSEIIEKHAKDSLMMNKNIE